MMISPQDEAFRSKAEREAERALAAHYRELGNPEIAAVLRRRALLQRQRQQRQQQAVLPRDTDQQS